MTCKKKQPGDIFYIKKGRKYYPAAITFNERLPEGFHLFYARPQNSGRLAKFNINPDKAGLVAAMMAVEGDLVSVLAKEMEFRPTTRLITKEQKQAWENFCNIMGDEKYLVAYSSIQTIVDNLVAKIIGDCNE